MTTYAQSCIDSLAQETPQSWTEIDWYYFQLISCYEDIEGPDSMRVEALRYLRWRQKWPRLLGLGGSLGTWGWRFWECQSSSAFNELGPVNWPDEFSDSLLSEYENEHPTFFQAVEFFTRCYPHLKPHLKPMGEVDESR